MKTLVLESSFKSKLDRLTNKVGNLTYLGANLESYKDLPIVAIVGTRKPTPYGKMMTTKIAEELSRAGVVIVSGNALGVDVIAQESALKAKGRVISVLPSGLDNIYPATNRPVAEKIIECNGTLISEFETNHVPREYDFLHRNRIVAALSDVVIIPEAAIRSGSLNTANHARTMGIPVFVVPGNTTSPMSGGTNQLLKEGARVITEASDIYDLLGLNITSKQTELNLIGDSDGETLVLKALASGITEQDTLHTDTNLSIIDIQMTLTMLEVQGRITQDSLGNWRLK